MILLSNCPAAPDEWFALPVLVRAGALAEKAQPRSDVSHAEHGLRAVFDQFRALGAGADFLVEHP